MIAVEESGKRLLDRQEPVNLRRAAASQYLLERHGINRAPNTLAKLACIGGGPKFRHANKTPLYPTKELDAWAESILTPLKSSTSDKEGVEA